VAGPVPEQRRPAIREVTGLAVAAAALCLWFALTGAMAGSATLSFVAPMFARNLATGFFLAAAMLRLASWRLTDSSEAAWSAVLLTAIGVALPIGALIEPLLNAGQVAEVEAPSARLFFVVPLVVLAVRLGSRRRVGAVVTAVGGGSIIGALAVWVAVQHPADAVLWTVVEAVTAGGWGLLALRIWQRRANSARPRGTKWTIAALLLMIVCELTKAWSVAAPGALHGLSVGFQLVAAGIIAGTSAAVLSAQMRTRSAEADGLGRAFAQIRDRLERIESSQHERLHDARSVVLGVKGASSLMLGREQATIDPASLRVLIESELERLQALLAPESPEPCVDFDLADALLPVAFTHRLNGLRVVTSIDAVRATGRATATTTVLDNLLTNAARHAPGARVVVTAGEVDGAVRIVVEDNGPGIPESDRARVLLPGVRGSNALGDGRGLGLYSATRMMAGQDGALSIETADSGGTRIVLTLPLAAQPSAAARELAASV
jgi:signal transduction histidine kinase